MFEQGSLLLVLFPFTDLSSQKRRPVLALTAPDQYGDFVALSVTSRGFHENSLSLDGGLKEGALPKPSWVRTDRVITLNASLVLKSFAVCSAALLQQVIYNHCAHLKGT